MLIGRKEPEFVSFVLKSLDRLYNDFKAVAVPPTLCELKDFRFDGGHVPNYNTKIIQQLYLLKFFPIYSIEYKYIYEKLIKDNIIDLNKIKILSIGAGCGLDFYGFYWAVQSKKMNIDILSQYKGIDVVNWDYKNLISEELSPNIIIDNIQNCSSINEDYNTIIFPKSIGEFDDSAFESVRNIFKKSDFKSDTLVIISSMREKNTSKDKDRLLELIYILGLRGYSTTNKDVIFSCTDGDKLYDFGISYPEDIKDFLFDMKRNCTEKPECKKECLEVLNYHNKPMNNTNYIKFQMVIFKKKEGVEIYDYDNLPF